MKVTKRLPVEERVCDDCGCQTQGYGHLCLKCVGLRQRKPKQESFCKDCGKKITFRCNRCVECLGRSKRVEETKCKDCGVVIGRNRVRCRSCNSKFRVGSNHPLYKAKPLCIDCSTPVVRRNAKRCKSCEIKRLKIPENNSNWKGGISNCPTCGKKLSTFQTKQCIACYSKTLTLERNPAWLGGLSFLPYTIQWTPKLREQIRTRDNSCCQECGFTNEEHLLRYRTQLAVHHIDYNKKNCNSNNLISLCGSCHMRTNLKRDYWQSYFEKKMSDRGIL